ncbi:MAG: hydantoinase B/oxoprolinase family protein [Deltaproteobacteria bacterium]|nr:hydantoinase B/oxoprolinase family protein [Deltaproteobacteria bacterium]
MAKMDMVTLQVVMNALHSITDEMNMALIRTAYSTNIKDRRDCSCAIYTPQGEVISQSELGSPVHLGIMPSALDGVLSRFKVEDMEDGDHIITNVPFPAGPGHLNDITMVSPVFIKGRIAFLVANMAHHVDLGGYAPGSMAIGLKEIFQEGLQIPPVKLAKRGRVDDEILAFIKQNVRTSREVDGDIHAQMACNNVGRKRLEELTGRYAVKTLHSYINELFDYSERRIRTGLKAIPQGTYSFEDFIEGTPLTQPLIKIKVTVTVEDEDITFDFEGTDPQVNESINSNKACVNTACYYIVKVLVDPGLPPNVGSYRPIHILAPEGTVVNAKAPAAIGNATIINSPKVVDVLLGALVEAVPKQAAAASNGVTSLFNIGGLNPRTGQLYSYVETYAGGQGAMHNQDGMDAVQCHMTNTRNAPVEVIEATYPLTITSYGLVPDSDGPGRFRGGLGMRREIKVLGQNTTLTVSTDRSQLKPWGVFGGLSGGNSACFIEDPDGRVEKLPISKMTRTLETGQSVTLVTPGAGGWGDPLTRDPQKVLWDVTEEFISPQRAREFYGVVVEKGPDRRFELNLEATKELRTRRQGGQEAASPGQPG